MKHKGTQDLKAWAKPLRETVYICLYLINSNYIYSVYAIVWYWELLASTTVTARCPQSELSLDASRWPKRNRRSGKACQPSRKSLRLKETLRDRIHLRLSDISLTPFTHISLCVLSRIFQPLDLSDPIGLSMPFAALRSIKPWSRSKLGDIRVAPGRCRQSTVDIRLILYSDYLRLTWAH